MAISYTDTVWNSTGTWTGTMSWREITVTVAVGDLLVAFGVSENVDSGEPYNSDRNITTQAGSTSAWTVARPAVINTSDVAFVAGYAVVTGAGSVTVRALVNGLSSSDWMGMGLYVIPAAEVGATYGFVGTGFVNDPDGQTPVTLSASSAVILMAGDWAASNMGTTTVPAGGTNQRSYFDNVHYAVWASTWRTQASGTRSYGPSGLTGHDVSGIAFRMDEVAGGTVQQASGSSSVVAGTSGAVTKRTPVSGTVAVAAVSSGASTRVPLILAAAGTAQAAVASSGNASRVAVVQSAAGIVVVSADSSGDAVRVTVTQAAAGTVSVSAASQGVVTERSSISGAAGVLSATAGVVTKRTQASGTSAVAVTAAGNATVIGAPVPSPAAGVVAASVLSSGAVSALLQASPFAVVRTNLAMNPRGTDLAFWDTNPPNGELSLGTGWGPYGTYVRITRKIAVSMRFGTRMDVPQFIAGEQYTVRFRVRASQAQSGVTTTLRPNFTSTLNQINLGGRSIPAGESVFEATFLIPTTLAVNNPGFAFTWSSGSVDSTIDITEVQIERSAVIVGPSFDGSTPNDTNNQYVWLGAPDVSTSAQLSNVTAVQVISGSQGDLTGRYSAGGVIPVTAAAEGSVTALKPAAGVVGALSSSSGSSTRVPRVLQAAGTVAAISTTAGAPSGEGDLGGTVSVTSLTSGSVRKITRVAGSAGISSATQGSVTSRAHVEGAVTVLTSSSGTLSGISQATGSIQVLSTAQGSLSGVKSASGVVTVLSTVTEIPPTTTLSLPKRMTLTAYSRRYAVGSARMGMKLVSSSPRVTMGGSDNMSKLSND